MKKKGLKTAPQLNFVRDRVESIRKWEQKSFQDERLSALPSSHVFNDFPTFITRSLIFIFMLVSSDQRNVPVMESKP